MISDVEKEITESKTEEENAQEEYDTLMQTRGKNGGWIHSPCQTKNQPKQILRSHCSNWPKTKKTTKFEVMATAETLKDLHLECDWFLNNFEARKEARAGEIDALKKAKAVLSGAD